MYLLLILFYYLLLKSYHPDSYELFMNRGIEIRARFCTFQNCAIFLKTFFIVKFFNFILQFNFGKILNYAILRILYEILIPKRFLLTSILSA